MKNLLFKYLATRIIIDAHPSNFTFACPAKNIKLSLDTFMYLAKEESKWVPIAIGEEIPKDNITDQDICRVDLFGLDYPQPALITLDKEDLLELFLEYGIGRCFEMSLLPQLRPIVFILGADQFSDYYKNPREVFENAAKLGGAKIIVFDKTEL